MNAADQDEYQENIEAILQNADGPIDPDLIITLATNFMLCGKPEKLIFRLRDERLPEDIVSLYAYFKTIEQFRKMFFEEKIFSSDQHDFKLKTIIGLLENAPIVKKINSEILPENEVINRLERLEILHKTSRVMEDEHFNDYLRGVLTKNPRIMSLRTYFVISLMTYRALSSMKREEYNLLRDIQRDLLTWRKSFLRLTNSTEELL